MGAGGGKGAEVYVVVFVFVVWAGGDGGRVCEGFGCIRGSQEGRSVL